MSDMTTDILVNCKRDLSRGVDDVEAWRGRVLSVPRVGDYIVLWDGWCGLPVLEVYHDFHNRTVEIVIGPDYTGEIQAYVNELAAKTQETTDE